MYSYFAAVLAIFRHRSSASYCACGPLTSIRKQPHLLSFHIFPSSPSPVLSPSSYTLPYTPSHALAVPLSGLQTARHKYYPPQPDFIRDFLYPLRVSFNFVPFYKSSRLSANVSLHRSFCPLIPIVCNSHGCATARRISNCRKSYRRISKCW